MCAKLSYQRSFFVVLVIVTVTAGAEEIWFEAEEASSITQPLQIIDDSTASGGQYITVESGNNSTSSPPSAGIAQYSLTVREGGIYRMYLRVLCSPDVDEDSSDSCWIRVQDAALNRTVAAEGWMNNNNIDFEATDSQNWFWSQLRHYADWPGNDFIEMTMEPGTYTVEIAYREDGLFIDGFLITNETDVEPAALPDEIPVPRPIATMPEPANGTEGLLGEVILSWKPGIYADTHNVFFGISFEDVNNAAIAESLGVIISEAQDVNTFNPGTLELGMTYYWRVDEVSTLPESTVYKGKIWSFSMEAIGFKMPAQSIIATASSQGPQEQGPQNTVNESGLDIEGRHSDEAATMWVSDINEPGQTWIQYEFDKVYKMHEMHIWNYNAMTVATGFGIRDVNILHSTDGIIWEELAGEHEFAQATGSTEYESNTTVELNGIAAKYIKLVPTSAWGIEAGQYGLSEVRFTYIPVRAQNPSPVSGITNHGLEVTLSWKEGREAEHHNVYISTDWLAVAEGTAPMTTVEQAEYGPIELDLDTTYYWRVDEVNMTEEPTTLAGDIWSFSTFEYIAVEDFEDYNDTEPDTLWNTWIDGWEDETNGSTMGHLELPFAEREIVHRGFQSAPVYFDNNDVNNSEVIASIAALDIGEDWTVGTPRSLSIWFFGDPNNDPNQSMYMKLNGMKVAYDGSPTDITVETWQEWNIDLSVFGDILSSVTDIAIGFEKTGTTGGAGMVLFDEIRLYGPRCMPWSVRPEADLNGDCIVDYEDVLILSEHWLETGLITTPNDPNTDELIVHYAMENNTEDSSGNGIHGIASGEPAFVEGPFGLGSAIELDGVDDYVDLGYNEALNPAGSFTVSLWANINDWSDDWGETMIATPGEDGEGFSIRKGSFWMGFFQGESGDGMVFTTRGVGLVNDWASSEDMQVQEPVLGQWVHICCVFDAENNLKTVYFDNEMVRQAETIEGTTLSPSVMRNGSLGARANSDNTGFEGLFTGSLDDIRMYNRVLAAGEIAYLAGVTEPYTVEEDLNKDGTVDFEDMDILMESWLESTLWPQ